MVSVVIPVYNGEKFIKKSIDSIIENWNGTYEIIIVDDGSTDETASICDSIAKNDTRIRIIHQKNAGVSNARNTGIYNAKGEWIIFVDADDLVQGEAINALDGIESSIDFVAFGTKKIQEWDRKQINKDELLLEVLGESNAIGFKMNAVWAKAYRKEMLDSNKIRFNEKLFHGEDLLFNVDVALKCKTAVILNKEIYKYIPTDTSATHKFQSNSLENEKIFTYEIDKRLGEDFNIDLKQKINNRINCMIINSIWIVCGQNICHTENKLKFGERKNILKNMIQMEPYKSVITKNINMENINSKQRMMVSLLKEKKYGSVIFMFMIRNRISK